MGKWLRSFAAFAVLLLPGMAASAQCIGNQVNGCPAAVSPQAGDFLLGYQINQFPHTRKTTAAQVLTGALQQRITGQVQTQISSAGNAGLNLGIGVAPTTCTPGDVWETGSGLFSCPNGSPVGPYGTGGSSLPTYATTAALPSVTVASAGQMAFVSTCPNGSQVGGGATGCIYVVDTTGTWTAQPNPTSQPITVGGQALFPGGSTANQGTGAKLQLATGAFIAGHALAFDANGNAIDSGVVPSGGTGGGGTVAGAPQNSLPFYTNSGTAAVVGGMSIVNNAVLATNGSGVPSEVTTLPTALTIPNATISSPTLTGTISISAATYTGKQTYVASTAGGASLTIPAGVAPTSPVNGDVWENTLGLFSRVNGTTQGPYIYSTTTTAPLAGGGVGPALTLTCSSCATTTNGGALAATAPITISAGGLIALGLQPSPLVWIADNSTIVHNDTYNLIESWPFTNSGTINSFVYHTGGSSASFTATLQINGVNVTGCSAISVSSTTDSTATCSAAKTISAGQSLSLVIASTTGSPTSAIVQANISKPAS